MDEVSIEFLRSIEDKEIAGLLNGLYMFFNSKFPPENYKTNPHINDHGYVMDYLGVVYNFNFNYEGSILNPKGSNIMFKLSAELPKIDSNLEQRINEAKVSNKWLDRTKYLADQTIESNGHLVNISCRIKKTPKDEYRINEFFDNLWSFIIKRAFTEIHVVE